MDDRSRQNFTDDPFEQKLLDGRSRPHRHWRAILMTALSLSGCTQQIPEAFRYQQQDELFKGTQRLNTKVDLLWVVDNSASMDATQEKLRNGFSAFAEKYLRPTWDIQIAVITTDIYLANPAFQTYLNTTITGSTAWVSPYLQSLGQAGTFPTGVKYGDLVPLWGSLYSRLLPGYHDGPITGFCFEAMPYFYAGVTDCQQRDSLLNSGPSHCLSPNTGAGETSLTECVNTTLNDSVRSGKAILQTKPPNGQDPTAWLTQLNQDFRVNATTGSVGQGSERGLSSILQFLTDNETSATKFFRQDSFRVIIFISDENDQSMELPTVAPAGFGPYTDYGCDQAGLIAANPAGNITGASGYCCANPANGCLFGDAGTTCPSVTVDGHSYTPSICADPSKLISIASVKSRLDTFFQDLDHVTWGGDIEPTYFVASIVPKDWASVSALQTARAANDTAAGALLTVAVEIGQRYLDLTTAVGNGSLSMDISASDYSPILDEIGASFIRKKGTFVLSRAPTNKEDMFLSIVGEDGTSRTVPSSKYIIEGKRITITDIETVLSIKDTDGIRINYQPRPPNT